MVVSSRFKEHFEIIEQDPFQEHHFYTASNNSNSSKPYHNSPQIYIDQQEYDLRRQSLSNTIDTLSTSASYSINGQCNLKRQSRVRTRRHKRQDSNGSSLTSSVSNNSIVGWCLKQNQRSQLYFVTSKKKSSFCFCCT